MSALSNRGNFYTSLSLENCGCTSYKNAVLLQEPKIPLPDLDFGGAVLAPILPHASGFQILVAPITAIGIGAFPPPAACLSPARVLT